MVYKLELTPSSQIHPIFHVSLLEKHVGTKMEITPNIPKVSIEIFNNSKQLETIVDVRH